MPHILVLRPNMATALQATMNPMNHPSVRRAYNNNISRQTVNVPTLTQKPVDVPVRERHNVAHEDTYIKQIPMYLPLCQLTRQ